MSDPTREKGNNDLHECLEINLQGGKAAGAKTAYTGYTLTLYARCYKMTQMVFEECDYSCQPSVCTYTTQLFSKNHSFLQRYHMKETECCNKKSVFVKQCEVLIFFLNGCLYQDKGYCLVWQSGVTF